MTRRSRVAEFIASFALLAGVGALGSCSTTEGDDSISEEEAPAAAAAFLCDAWYECDCDGYSNEYSSEEECRAQLEADVQGAIDGGNAAELTYDPECIEGLGELLDALDCAGTIEVFLYGTGAQELAALQSCKIFYGDAGVGDACELLVDDDGDAYGDSCKQDLACRDGQCEALDVGQRQGQPCADTAECDAGLLCVPADGVEETCEVLPPPGQTCLGAANLCALDAWCDLESKDCVVLPGAGQACSVLPSALGQRCALGAECDTDDMCVVAPGEGEACTTVCAEGFACDNAVCVEVHPLTCDIASDE